MSMCESGLPGWHRGKGPACQRRRHRRCGFSPWIGRIPWRRKRQPSSILACDIPWTEEPGALQSMGLQTVRYNYATEHACTCECMCVYIHISTENYPQKHILQ